MTIETKEASPPGGAESECLPPSKVSGKRPYLTKRSKPRVKKAQIARQLISDCCSSAEIKDFESISTTSAAGMMNGRIPLNDLIVVPESCMILEMFENASSTEDKSTSSGSNSAIGTQSQESSPIVASSRKRGTKRAKKTKEGSKGDSFLDSKSTAPSRKSKRLLFRNTHKAIANKKVNGNESDSISPYGRLVELIDHQPELDRDDFLTKCLFLGNLDLTFTNPGSLQLPKTNNIDLKTEIHPSSSMSTPKQIFNPLSLKTLCVLNIVKRKKHEYVQQELKYFSQIDKPEINKDNNSEDSWLNFEEHMSNLRPEKMGGAAVVQDGLSEEKIVEKLHRCGTIITFGGISPPQNNGAFDHSGSSTKIGERKWFNWGEHMAKTLQIEKSISIISKNVIQPGRREGVGVVGIQGKSRKISQRKRAVRA